MKKYHIWWYGVCTMVASILQNIPNKKGTAIEHYIIGRGDVASTLLLALYLWAISKGIELTIELIRGVVNLESYRREKRSEK